MEQKLYSQGDKSVGSKIAALRAAHNFSLQDVVIYFDRMGVKIDKSHLWKIENGQRNISFSMLAGFKIIFNCDYSDFFGEIEKDLRELLGE